MAERLINADALPRHGKRKGLIYSADVDKAPTVDAVPVVHGRWTRENSYGIWKCSECGCKVKRANPLKGNIWNYYYCPNCGADMRGEQDG